MKNYAHILADGTVNMIVVKKADIVNFKKASGFVLIDPDGYTPPPQQGWVYDADKDEFFDPNPEPEPLPEKPEEEIDADTLSQSEINKLILKKLGYKVKEAK